MTKKYRCAVHGEEGNPNCPECCRNLGLLLKEKNAYVVATGEDKKKLGVSK